MATFVESSDLNAVRTVQDGMFGYERDISKHLGSADAEYALSAWRSLPSHLGQENKKFVFGHIRDGTRARDYRSAITWLVQAGIATKVPGVSKPEIPLAAHADESAFKLFALDIGLLCAISGLDASSIVDGNALFTELKGAHCALSGKLDERSMHMPKASISEKPQSALDDYRGFGFK